MEGAAGGAGGEGGEGGGRQGAGEFGHVGSKVRLEGFHERRGHGVILHRKRQTLQSIGPAGQLGLAMPGQHRTQIIAEGAALLRRQA